MSEFYTIIVIILGVLALSGLFVGVSNDAVNFLIAAIGSKVAKMKTILIVASAGILLGVMTSSGMMDVARFGAFNPALFTFHEVMILYLAVMFANVILLDLYNSLGLPTSTTVALIFCLLGSAIAVSLTKLSGGFTLPADYVMPQSLPSGLSIPADGVVALSDLLNTSKVLSMIVGILLSVVISFTVGTFTMYISRLIFSFRYTAVLRKFGAFWCGISFTAIVYFAIFKGLKGLMSKSVVFHDFSNLVNENVVVSLFICWLGCSLLLFILQRLKINILRITILAGTFALALAFAGNDLVNFIGVPIAGFDSFFIANNAGGGEGMYMTQLLESTPANMIFILTAGVVMVITLWTSKKAMHVTETEVSLSKQDEGGDMYGSTKFSRALVRGAITVNNTITKFVPQSMVEKISNRFRQEDIEHTGAPFDMIRATVNLTTSALIISIATITFKLPLSTTYVSFMVAMGSSLADKAWGRESAVYRITGVMTVIAGWFITGFGGFVIAFGVAMILIYGGVPAFVIVTLLVGYMFIRSNFLAKKKVENVDEAKSEETTDIIEEIRAEVSRHMKIVTRSYDRTLEALFAEDIKALQKSLKESKELLEESSARKHGLPPILKRLQDSEIDTAHYYVQVVDFLNEMSKSLTHITRPAFDHIDNNHEGLNKAQIEDLKSINERVEIIFGHINTMLHSGDFEQIDTVLELRDQLFDSIAKIIKSEIRRVKAGKTSTKASILYLTILTETKNMILQSRNLIKSQRYFLEQSEDKNKENLTDIEVKPLS